MPGYPVVIAALRFIGIPAASVPSWLVILQALAELLTAWSIYRLGYRRFSPRAALIAALLWLTFPPAVGISMWITTETFFAAAFMFGFLLLAGETDDHVPSAGRIAAAAAVLGLTTMLRATPMLLVLALLIPIVWSKAGLRQAAALAAIYCCFIVPWIVRNRIVLDDNIGLALGFGSVLMQGSSEESFDGRLKEAAYVRWTEEAAATGLHKPTITKASVAESWMMRLAWEQYRKRWRDRPWSYPRFLLVKLARLWYGTETLSTRRDMALLALSAVVAIPGLVWLVYGCLRRARAKPGGLWRSLTLFDCAVLATLGYFITLHFISLPMIRYMMPIYPLLFLGTGSLADILLNNNRSAPSADLK